MRRWQEIVVAGLAAALVYLLPAAAVANSNGDISVREGQHQTSTSSFFKSMEKFFKGHEYGKRPAQPAVPETLHKPITPPVSSPVVRQPIVHHLVASHEIVKVFAGIGGIIGGTVIGGASGVVTGGIVDLAVCGGRGGFDCLIYPAVGLIVGFFAGSFLGMDGGVALAGHALHEDGTFWGAFLGSMTGPVFMLSYCTVNGYDECGADQVAWYIGGALTFVGTFAGYDLTRSYSISKDVSIEIEPQIFPIRQANRLTISANVLKITF